MVQFARKARYSQSYTTVTLLVWSFHITSFTIILPSAIYKFIFEDVVVINQGGTIPNRKKYQRRRLINDSYATCT